MDNVLVEWDRNMIWAATDTGLYALSCPNLGKAQSRSHAGRRVVASDKLNEGAV